MNASWRLQTPPPGAPDAAGAVAIFELEGDVPRALGALGVAPVGVGEVRVRDLAGVDTGVVARCSESVASLMPHGGPFIVSRLSQALEGAGIPRAGPRWAPSPTTGQTPPPAVLRELVLDAIAAAPSPRAVDLLLDQLEANRPLVGACASGLSDEDLARVRSRLLRPPLVAALGPANIGKSALLNALAGRSVSIVADEPGTTRDHVGALLDLDGLVVRYADTPGVRTLPDGCSLEQEARDLAVRLAAGADLLLLCGDTGSPPLDPAALSAALGAIPALRVGTRCDLAEPRWTSDLMTSALTGQGLPELAGTIRELLVPTPALEDPRPWRFWLPDAP